MKITKDVHGIVRISPPISKAEKIALEIMLNALQEISHKCFGRNNYLDKLSKDADLANLELLENMSQRAEKA